MTTNWYRILEKPLITEKSTLMQEHGNRVMFQVQRSANKMQIKEAVQKIFNVTVLDVNTINVKPKSRRFGRHMGKTKAWKKAIVLLKEGDTIDFFQGA
ncbi:MAG: 50S ribosomal protein L23 [Nitrospinaceae bacterium]|nr:50S ribosomal protein L23 [Nitrospinaceae bacterium]NIR55555.1 50S ribosomal protein L23 [Nitrospinaceae bacterium]NIS85989.1 50S ribosomal protein L23 [Nitrospinaceae bacterium]NIT82835.1 50S ribosomal protein L23 [Nitrospinaceae bacterium]NIU45037.1 50S ribosomal protein L23 [Nitrospinaceae bacterium]